MTIATTLAAVTALVRQADPRVQVGTPVAASIGLSLWPWRYAPVASIAPPSPRPGQPPLLRTTAFDLHLLVLPRSASSGDDLAAIDRTLALIASAPVLPTSDGVVRLTLETGIAHADLAALFSAAGVPMSLCIELVARMTPN